MWSGAACYVGAKMLWRLRSRLVGLDRLLSQVTISFQGWHQQWWSSIKVLFLIDVPLRSLLSPSRWCPFWRLSFPLLGGCLLLLGINPCQVRDWAPLTQLGAFVSVRRDNVSQPATNNMIGSREAHWKPSVIFFLSHGWFCLVQYIVETKIL